MATHRPRSVIGQYTTHHPQAPIIVAVFVPSRFSRKHGGERSAEEAN